jgi:hypothetical protein
MSDEETTVVVTSTPAPIPVIPIDAPKAPSAALKSLAAKREALKENLYLDLQVPRWSEPEIFVRYGPVDMTLTENVVEKRRKSKIPEWSILANADILAQACIGIYACLDEDYETKYSLRSGDENGSWTKFDPDMADALGSQLQGASEVVRALYLTDGDLLEAAKRVTEWSGIKNAEVDSDF